MSTVERLAATLHVLGVRLHADGDQLRVDAPTGVLTPELRAELAAAKPALLARLRRAAPGAEPIAPVPRTSAMPLSFAQERLWFMDQLVPGSSFYNMAECLRLRGPLDPAALERAIREIVRRHETLRTEFRVENGRAVQSVADHLELPMPVTDLRHVPEADRVAAAIRFGEDEARRPFDISRPPLLRVHLLVLAGDDHVVVATMHHLVSDGWSLQRFRHEVVLLYEAFAAGRPSPLPPLEIQYADFAAWQRERQGDDALEAQLEYWRAQLAGAAPLELPGDRPRPPVPSFEGRSIPFSLSPEATSGLKALAAREHASLFAPLLAVFAVVMSRHAGREDVVIGSPVANRTRHELEPLIGFFVNTLALRVDLSGAPTFAELTRRVRAMALGAFGNQDLPFERVVAELQPERSASRNPLVQVVFALQNAPPAAARLRGLSIEPMHFERGRVRMDLELHLWEDAGAVQGLLIFAIDLFDDGTAGRIVEHLRRAADQAALAPDGPISSISLLTDHDRARLVEGWEGTRRVFTDHRPVHERVAEQGRLRPAHVAVRCGDRALTYGELNHRADALAFRLRALGAGPGRIVAVCCERSPELVVAELAALRAGAGYLPLDPAHPRERNADMLADAAPCALVTVASLAEGLASPDRPTVLADDRSTVLVDDTGAVPSLSSPAPAGEPEPDDPAFVIYTSGSTGRPKGVVIPHRGLLNLVLWHQETFGLTPDDCTSHLAAITFDASVVETWPTLAAGATLCQVPGELVYDVARLPAFLAAQGVTTGFFPTSLADLLLQREWPAGGRMRAVLVGGDRLVRFPPPALPFAVVNVYGPTECCVLTTTGRVDPAPRGAGRPHIGRPLANVRVYVLEPGGEPAPPGVPGELYVAGPGVGTGYLNRPALTAERFVPDPFGEPASRMYRTGDRARLLHDGNYDFIDRLDRQVKIRGFRVEPGEIERRLGQHPGVRQAVVTVGEDPAGGRRLAAYVVPEAAGPDDDPALRERAEARVEQWKKLYEETYGGAAAAAPAFDLVGWNSSYTGEPLSAGEMREWVEQTVERVLRPAPRRVLEIGCGTGLLLHRVAPRVQEYWATDFSGVVLAQLRRQVDQGLLPGARVVLMNRRAHDFEGIPERSFDAVILSSVVQYFPGVDYLAEVVEQAVRRAAPGGVVYLGDLRDRGLQRAFQASVELGSAPAGLPLDALRARVRRAIDHDEELLVDPALFSALRARIPRISRVEAQLRRGVHHNELTAFRFDAVLFVDEEPRETRDCPVLPWSDGWGGGVRPMEEALRRDAPELLRVTGVPNARVAGHLRALRLLEGGREMESVGRLRAAAAGGAAPAVDPEEVWRTAEALGYTARVSRGAADPGRMDVVLLRHGVTALPAGDEVPVPRPLHEYASDPLWRVRVQALLPRLRAYLRERLPEWMVPAHLVALRELPLTPNGKVDRAALPAPQGAGPAAAPAALASPTESLVAGVWCELLGREAIGPDENFFDCGGHSLMLVEAQSRLSARLAREIPVVALFQHPTIRSLGAYLDALPSAVAPLAADAGGARRDAVAIIGMSCRFPGARNPAELWGLLSRGERAIRELSVDEVVAAGVDRGLAARADYVKAAAVLPEIEDFDSGFFAFTPQEARITDPQHRLFLECAYEALESAGYPTGRAPLFAGVFAGAAMNAYFFNNILPHRESLDAADFMSLRIGNSSDFLASRVAYKLNLSGPAVNVQTTCSTSLVAVHYACRSLLAGECTMALAGGVAINVPQGTGYLYRDGMILSPDGHCRAFDRQARGTVPGGGAGVVLLKRLADAVADGDPIHAVILGSAVNNDGAEKVGFTAPGLVGQARVVAGALAAAGVPATSIGYVEAHGTATRLGDPIEVAALTQAYRASSGGAPPPARSCAIGSLKTNIGHADAAAGVAGLIKAALVLRHGVIPPSLDFTEPNPELRLDDGPFYVAAAAAPWERGEHPRRAGVSSFGIGGTNAHAVVEEAPLRRSEPSSRPAHLLLVSGRGPEALAARAALLADDLAAGHEVADVAFTLQTARTHFAHRGMVVHPSAAGAGEDALPRRLATGVCPETPPAVAFMFPGQGSQFAGMGRGLYHAEPVFRAELDRCRELLRPLLDVDLFDLLFPSGAERAGADERLRGTALAQPALVAVEYALARLWMSLGVQPRMLIGHSVGEYAAACIAGVLTLEEALRVVAARGRLIQALPAGAMLAASIPAGQLALLLGGGLSLAAVNRPDLCVASGPAAEIGRLRGELERDGVTCTLLHTSHAFHSAMMDPVLRDFRRLMSGVALRPPAIPILSNLTGAPLTDEEATDPDYWTSHLRGTVRFSDGLERIFQEPGVAVLEVGPGRALTTAALRHPARAHGQTCAASLPRPDEGQPETADHAAWLEAVGHLWLAGAEVEWTKLYAGERRLRVPLATYPFQRERAWIDAPRVPSNGAAASASSALRPANAEAARLYRPRWVADSSAPAPAGAAARHWLLFVNDDARGRAVADGLVRHGEVTVVRAGTGFGRDDGRAFTVRPDEAEDHRRLFEALHDSGAGPAPDRIVYLWTSGGEAPGDVHAGGGARGVPAGFLGLLHLAAAAGARGHAARIAVVTEAAARVEPGDPVDPWSALFLGPCLVIPREFPLLSCVSVDVDACAAVGAGDAAGPLIAELLREDPADPGPSAPPRVALRGGRRFLLEHEEVDDASLAPPVPLRMRGVYLVTGGLGGIGRAIAEHLAKSVRARLVLVGRSADPESDQARALCRAIEALGGEALVVRADAADAAAMRRAVDAARARFGHIDVAIHSAGVAGGGLIGSKTAAEVARVFAPKVAGTLVLAECLEADPPELLVLCSSLVTTAGGVGQVDYCGANAFLDAFAQAHAPRTVAIDWDAWREVGMAVNTPVPPEMRAEREALLRTGLATAQGVQAFERALRAGTGQVIVAAAPLSERLATLRGEPPAGPSAAAGLGVAAGDAAGDEIERTVTRIWRELLGHETIGPHDSFFALGGDSLLAIRAVGRAREAFQVDIPLGHLLAAPTVAGAAEAIRRRLRDAAPPSAPAHGAPGPDPRNGAPSHAAGGEWSSVVPLNPGGTGRGQAFFCIHPIAGVAFPYDELARLLGAAHAVYAIEAVGLSAGAPLRRMEEVAGECVRAIRAIQPEGPYAVGGWSFGALAAFEVAARLRAAGCEVSLLALIDQPAPRLLGEGFGTRDRLAMVFALTRGVWPYVAAFFAQPPSASKENGTRRGVGARWLMLREQGGIAGRVLGVVRGNLEAAWRWSPAAAPVRVTLLRTERFLSREIADPHWGWDALARDGVVVHEVPGSHMVLLQQPHVDALAGRLRACLDASASSPPA